MTTIIPLYVQRTTLYLVDFVCSPFVRKPPSPPTTTAYNNTQGITLYSITITAVQLDIDRSTWQYDFIVYCVIVLLFVSRDICFMN